MVEGADREGRRVSERCPWDFLAGAEGGFCEAALCGWVREPANTWTNLGLLVAGAWMWRRAGAVGVSPLRWLAVAAFGTGVGSAFFHASGTSVGGTADQLGMFLGTGAMTGLNAGRLFGWSSRGIALTALGVTTALVAPAIAFPEISRWIFALGAPCVVTEAILFLRDGRRTHYGYYLGSGAVIGVAALLWWLDSSGRWCDPHNHILNGHGLWHLFVAVAWALLFRFYEQFPSLERPVSF